MAYRLVEIAARNFRERPADLRLLDLRRHATRTGSSTSRCSATPPTPTCSAGTLKGVADRVDYLAELGVTYLHLLPLLKPRPAPNDGGYAVMDYRAVREDLGTIATCATWPPPCAPAASR
jgi:amylosucrase